MGHTLGQYQQTIGQDSLSYIARGIFGHTDIINQRCRHATPRTFIVSQPAEDWPRPPSSVNWLNEVPKKSSLKRRGLDAAEKSLVKGTDSAVPQALCLQCGFSR